MPGFSRRLIPFALVGVVAITTGLAAGYGQTDSPPIVAPAIPELGTAAQARALDAIVRHSMQASSFTRTTALETLVYQAPDRTRVVLTSTNDPPQTSSTITIGSTEYDSFGTLAGPSGCWTVAPAPTHNQVAGRTYALGDLTGLLHYSTALRQGDHFVVRKVVPATLLSVTPISVTVTTSQKVYQEQQAHDRAQLSFLRHSKGLLEVTTTVTVRRGFVVAVHTEEQGSFNSPDNQVVARHIEFGDSYGRFNSSPPVVPPPAGAVLAQSANGTLGPGARLLACVSPTSPLPAPKGVTAAMQNQYLALSQPLSAANVAFVTAVVAHYTTTSNADAKRVGQPLVAVLTNANTALSDDRWPPGARASVKSLVRARQRMIADIEDLPPHGDVTSAWVKKLYDDGASAGSLDDTVRYELGLPSLEAGSS